MRSRLPNQALLLLAVAAVCVIGRFAEAEVFILSGDGRVTGELVNKDEQPREKYVIRTTTGATVTLDRSQVKQILAPSPARAEFEQIRPTFADTAEDQWRLAQWCLKQNLAAQRREVLQRVIELDGDHVAARMALGYTQFEGRWIRPDQLHQEQGYVRYRGQWLTPQEIAVIERRENFDSLQRNWHRELARMRAALDDPVQAEKMSQAIRNIDDPLAIDALASALDSERNRAVRVLYVQALGRIGTSAAIRALVTRSLGDYDEEVRLTCLDQLIARPAPEAVSLYVDALRSKDNVRVNRAAYALGKLQDMSAIPALINALVTTHKVKIASGGPNSISAGFGGPGGGGLSVGGGSQIRSQHRKNQHVLDALVSLSGGMNYQFDRTAWKNWYASQSKPVHLDVRRD